MGGFCAIAIFLTDLMPDSLALDTKASQAPEKAPARITLRSVLLGAATVVILNIYADYAGMVMGSFSLNKSQFPMAMLIPFGLWLFVNLGLKAFFPRAALSGTELLVIYSMSWIAGNIPFEGFTGYWASTLAAPTYFASPENRWEEAFFDALPWWYMPDASPAVIRPYYDGLAPETPVPWVGWIRPLFWGTAVPIAVLTAGICAFVILQRQWEDAERLTYPLAQFAVELTSGFDEPGRVPRLFRDGVFWAGFFLVFGIFLWNIVGYFAVVLPEITVFGFYLTKAVHVSRDFPPVYLRVLPTVIGLTYFCNLDILLSLWAFRLLAIFKLGIMNRTGFGIGLSGQQAPPSGILDLEGYGAMVLLALWSVWVARGHLQRVWRTALGGGGAPKDEETASYRIALLGFGISTVFIVGLMHAFGISLPIAIAHTLMLYIAYLIVAKFTAASGFTHLFPVAVKGGPMLETLVGTANLSRGDLVGIGMVNTGAFFGNLRIPAWPALPHHFKLLSSLTRRRSLVVWLALLAFLAGLFASFFFVIYLPYIYGGQNLHKGPFNPEGALVAPFNRLAAKVLESDLTVFDSAKVGVCLFGALEVLLMIVLRNRLPWWPLHPLGLAFQNTTGPRIYAFSIFLTWAAKSLIMRIGGIGLYRRAAPFFIGLPMGYVAGVFLSSFVDYIWFPLGDGHYVHGW